MSKVNIFDKPISKINYKTRIAKLGKEYILVEKYLKSIIKSARNNKVYETSIFIEPRIESGYPDIVIVKHLPIRNNQLRDIMLNKIDLRILYFIQLNKQVEFNKIVEVLGYSEKEINSTINRLSKCNLIKTQIDKNQIYSIISCKNRIIRSVISIEAKIDKWNEAIAQAAINSWFSTESYILLNKNTCNDAILNKCRDLGIGIILVNGRVDKILKSAVRKFPVSYASLQFYDWVIMSKNIKGENI